MNYGTVIDDPSTAKTPGGFLARLRAQSDELAGLEARVTEVERRLVTIAIVKVAATN